MKIYTKQGDQGETGLFGGSRVPKDHLRIQSYGTLDELNAALGLAQAPVPGLLAMDGGLAAHLKVVQSELFRLGAELATPHGKTSKIGLVGTESVERLEQEIDAMEKTLPPLKSFILPGGVLAATHLHIARTICRRAERELVSLNREEPLRAELLKYVNRLSDFLFVAARFVNHQANVADVPWVHE